MNDIWPTSTPSDSRNAFFEAGHAVVAWLHGLEIEQVSIGNMDDPSSWIDKREPDWSQDRLGSSREARADAIAVIRGLLAGPAAERRYSFGACDADFNIADEGLIGEETAWRAISIAGSIETGGSPLIPRLWQDVSTAIQTPNIWMAIEAVADALLRDRELAGCEIEEIVRHAMSQAVS